MIELTADERAALADLEADELERLAAADDLVYRLSGNAEHVGGALGADLTDEFGDKLTAPGGELGDRGEAAG